MPGILLPQLRRRNFLKLAGLGCAAIATHALGASTGSELHLALLSDTHVPADKINGHRGFNPWENLNRIIPDVAATNADGMILNGDASRLEGLPADYTVLKEMLQPVSSKMPIYIGMGNHDDRAGFNKVFTQPTGTAQSVKDKQVLVIQHAALRIIVLDSLLYTNKTAGLLGNTQRKWLADYLAANKDRPVVIFVHHTLDDNDGDLADSPRLFELLKPHSHVKAIFYGHSHVWEMKERQGLHLVNLPSVGYNFKDADPVGWVDARFQKNQVDLTLHAFAGNRAQDGKSFTLKWS